jgi:hypothetical protein
MNMQHHNINMRMFKYTAKGDMVPEATTVQYSTVQAQQ